MIAWTLFHHPMLLTNELAQLALVVPLCAAVAVVYKTIREPDMQRLFWRIVVLLAYMLGGLCALGAAMWLIHQYWA